MSDTYKKKLIQAGLLQIFHKIESSQPKMLEHELVLRASRIIKNFLPAYNYVIWRLEKLNPKSHDNELEDVVFEEYIILKEHCYGIAIFQKGKWKLHEKYKHPYELLYGGPKAPFILAKIDHKSSCSFKFWKKPQRPMLISFLTVDVFNQEKEFDEVLKKLEDELRSDQ